MNPVTSTNYILFLCDDLVLDDIGCRGGKVYTPNIDRLVRGGAIFTEHHCAAPVCTPSRWEWLSGQYAMRCRSASFRQYRDTVNPPGDTPCITWNTWFDGTTPTIAHAFAAGGYNTAFFGKWHTGPEFKDLVGPDLAPDADPADPAVDLKLKALQQRMVAHLTTDGGFTHAGAITSGNRESCTVKALRRHHNPEWATDAALRFLDRHGREKPFFLHFASTLPHGDAPNEEIDRDPRITMGGYLDQVPFGAEKRKTLRTRLAAAGLDPNYHRALAMLSIDDQVGAILDRLEALGLADNTVFVFSCDHGLEPGKGSVFEEGTRIPAAVRWPGLIRPGATCTARAMNVDWGATFLADAGLPLPQPCDGIDLRPVLSGARAEVRAHFIFNMGYHRAISDGRWKYVALRYPRHALARMQAPDAVEAVNFLDMAQQGQALIVAQCYPASHDSDQLYDLLSDPNEQVNRWVDPLCAAKGRQLQEALRCIVATVPDNHFDVADTVFLRSPRFAELVAALRRRSIGAVAWFPPELFPFKNGKRHV
jgi:arylsulfatase A-like enzyme